MPAPNRSLSAKARQRVPPCIARMRVCSKRWIEVDGQFAIGQGGGELLEAVASAGSLAQAARKVGWSYRHAWGYVKRAESVLGVQLLSTRAGKGSARGTMLTPDAATVMETLRG